MLFLPKLTRSLIAISVRIIAFFAEPRLTHARQTLQVSATLSAQTGFFFFLNCEAELEFSGDAAGTVGTARWENNPA